ncbi:MAG: DeoR/GlpR family DNA-binding transcription regulator [Proteocatella sp.]
MLAIERRNQILLKLQKESKVLVSDLSQTYEVTEETIRRDLEKLEKEGFAKKTYGGAVLKESLYSDLPYNVRKETNVKSKKKIAQTIGAMIEDGDCIALDASSTALYIIKEIKNKNNITVLTNSIEILLELSDKKDWKILSTGGTLKEGSLSLLGYQAEKMIDNFHVDKAIVSCKGVDAEFGVTDSNELDAEIKKHFFGAATQKILAVDSTKLDRKSFTKIVEISGIDILVTDQKPEKKWEEICSKSNVEIHY